jgi:uncharacterized protein involved in exopolysaccharide biosynthesis
MRQLQLLACLAVMADCTRPPPPPPDAVGTLIFEAEAAFGGCDGKPERVDAFLATEREVLTSRILAKRVVQLMGLERDKEFGEQAIERVHSSLAARRREGALVLELAVRHRDPMIARQICNGTLESYVSARFEQRHDQILAELQSFQAQKEAATKQGAEAARLEALDHKIQELQLAASIRKSDVRILDACAVVAKRGP